MIGKGFTVIIGLLLAGCAGLRLPNLADRQEERQVIHLIDYAQRVATMTAEQQRIEYSASNQAFAMDKDAISRMRLALLLATPGASIHDAARAASLLEPMTAPSDDASPLRSLARLLYAQLNERASEQKRANQMREQFEARKEAARTLREQLEARKESEQALREQLDARKEAEHALREQLDALKEVERTVMQRGQEGQSRRK
jgi:hypothetical protein